MNTLRVRRKQRPKINEKFIKTASFLQLWRNHSQNLNKLCMEVQKMGKKLESVQEIVVKNNETGGELKYLSMKEPNKNNLGNAFRGTIGPLGIAKAQANGHNIVDNDSYIALIAKFLGLEVSDFGVGPNWATPEERAKFSVSVGGVEFQPSISAKVLAKLETPTIVAPVVAEQVAEPVATADKTPAKKEWNEADIQKIKLYLAEGHKEQDIVAKLTEVYGKDTATEMMAKANPVAQAPTISFDAPQPKAVAEPQAIKSIF